MPNADNSKPPIEASEQVAGHTPGPWCIDAQYIVAPDQQDANNWDEATICQWGSYSTEANARLIAAAPETAAERDRLREALEAIVLIRDGRTHMVDKLQLIEDVARAALKGGET